MAVTLLLLVVSVLPALTTASYRPESEAAAWLEEYLERAVPIHQSRVLSRWHYYTNVTATNYKKMNEELAKAGAFFSEAGRNASKFDWMNFQDANLKRMFRLITDIGNDAISEEKQKKLSSLRGELIGLYTHGKVCGRPSDTNRSKCYTSGGVNSIIATSNNWDDLVWVWHGWRNATGRKMKDKYEMMVDLMNEAARANKYIDEADKRRSRYGEEDIAAAAVRCLNQLKPLYQKLHAYVLRKLKEKYRAHAHYFPRTGHIPAHLLGNMWAQNWAALADELMPFPNKTNFDVTAALKKQNFDPKKMFKLVERLFTSIGLGPMPEQYWKNSVLEKPKDVRMSCSPLTWSMYNGTDVRTQMCTQVNKNDLINIHRQLALAVSALHFAELPVEYRGGSNPAFTRATADSFGMLVRSPAYLHSIGLLPTAETDRGADINELFKYALDQVAFVPFGVLVDVWRWGVWGGETPKNQYNRKWWELRCKYQGVTPPVMRTEADFDPGSKYHVPANVDYLVYSVGMIQQHQFFKAMCDNAGHTGPLYKCNFYGSKEAGEKMGAMMSVGYSKPWQDAMERLTGQRKLDAGPMLEYFKPLSDWLDEQNDGQPVGWKGECPTLADFTSGAWITEGAACLIMGLLFLNLNFF